MYATIGEAKAAFEEYFYEEGVEFLIGQLRPAIGFEPTGGPAELGATRIGGTPDLPVGRSWPVRPVPDDLEAIVARGGAFAASLAARISNRLARPLPFGFVAQVDLAEAAALGDVASELPTQGRLLFFYDLAGGLWLEGGECCRVIFDETPREELTRASLAPELVDFFVEERRRISRPKPGPEHSWDVDEATPSAYWGPARAMRLRTVLQLPDWCCPEAQEADPLAEDELVEELRDEDFREAYVALFDDLKGAARQQLLGLPNPEQQDPRYRAVEVTDFGELDEEALSVCRPRVMERAGDWRLLLQVDLQDFLQQKFVEGTVYFLIRRDDLAARDFDRVVAIYQQT